MGDPPAPRPGPPADVAETGTVEPDASWVPPELEFAPDPEHGIVHEHARAKVRAQLFQIESDPVRIGRFPILGPLGQGGMGAVFSAYDEELDRRIAVKVMLASAAAGTQGRERMRREAQAMARLSPPNIVAVHEVGVADDQLFIAMEFVRGVSLDVWLSRQPRSWRVVLDVFRQAGRGLMAAHGAGLVHRDFKPSNVMVGDDGQIKILDFGLARAAVDTTATDAAVAAEGTAGIASLTRTGAITGTPAFMAPEQLLGEAATAASDQFSFCVALYAAFFGRPPFEGKNLAALVAAVCDGTPAPPPRDSDVPAWLRRAVMQGLAREPERRHASMAALLDALGDDPSARRRRWIFAAVGIALLVVGGFGIARLAAAEPCPDGRRALQGAWDDDRRARVAAALRSGATHGEATWARVEPALDAYAESWIVARESACGALRDGAVSELLHDRGVACLSRSRTALDALVEVFEHADSTVVDKAVSAVTGLPALARCEDADALLAEVAPPDAAIAAEVATLRETLARARSVEEAGRVAESVAAADEVLAHAERLGYAPLVAEALLRRGSGELIAGQPTEADDDLGRATWGAVAGGDDAVAAEAAARRIFVRSELLGRPADAEIELPWARALVDRTGDDALLGLFLHNAAAVESRSGDPAQARALAREALAARRRFAAPEHPDIALTLANLGRFERDLGEFTAALESLREAVRVTEVALGPRHPQRAMIGSVLASTLLDLQQDAEAKRELALDDAIYRETLGDAALPRYYVLVAMGELATRERRLDEGRLHLEEALRLATAAVGEEHPMLTDARLALAEILAAQGQLREAEATGRDAVARLEGALGPGHPYLAEAWLRLARLLLAAGERRQAEPCFARALELARAIPELSSADLGWYELWHAAGSLGSDPQTRRARMEEIAAVLTAAWAAEDPRLRDVRAALAAQPRD
jgi:tetratricopeptide (TPR) repeat protein